MTLQYDHFDIAPATQARAEALLAQGQVTNLSVSSNQIKAQVQGTHLYPVVLDVSDGRLSDAQCTCPAFEYQHLCKHCVAVLLAVEAQAAGKTVATAVPPALSKSDREEATIRQFLAEQPHTALADALMDFILDDRAAFKLWLIKAELSRQNCSEKDLKKLITKALPKRQLWGYAKVADYFQSAEAVLEVVLNKSDALKPDAQFKLLNHCYARLNSVLEQIDDSGGARFYLESLLEARIASVFNQLAWSDEKKAQWLVQQLETGYDLFPSVPDAFKPSPGVQAKFVEQCQQAFDALDLPDDLGARRWHYPSMRLGRVLLDDAEARDDTAARIRIMARLASGVDDLVKIGELCLAKGDEFAAEDWLKRAEKAKAHPHEVATRENFKIRVYHALGRGDEAWDLAWQRFKKSPSFPAYCNLAKQAQQLGVDESAYVAAVETELQQLYPSEGHELGRQHLHFNAALEYYCHRGEWDKAIAWAINHKVDADSLMQLAVVACPINPDDAFAFMERALPVKLKINNKDTTEHVVGELVQLRKACEASPALLARFDTLLNELIDQYRRRRNFVAALEARFK